MKYLSESEMKTINGGSETIKRFGAWLKKTLCEWKNAEKPEKTWNGNGNHVW